MPRWSERKAALGGRPRWVVAAVVGVALVVAGVLIAGTGGDGGDSASGALVFGAEPPPISVADGDLGGTCEAEAPGPADGTDANGTPFESAGARQVPGPAMTVTSIPATPVSVVVSSPPNPDERSAAAQVSGTGSPTPTYLATASPTTSTTRRSATTPAPRACGGGL